MPDTCLSIPTVHINSNKSYCWQHFLLLMCTVL